MFSLHQFFRILFLLPGVTAPILAQTAVLDVSFDGNGGNDTGPTFGIVSNGTEDNSTTNPSTGLISFDDEGTGTPTVGFSTTTALDLSAETGFTVEWTVSGGSPTNAASIAANGWFFGVQNAQGVTGSQGSLWNNDPRAIGVILYNTNVGGDLPGLAFSTASGDSPSSQETNTGLSVSAPSEASLNDGFTISLTINSDDTWSASSTGLSDDFSASGNLGSVNYSDIASTLFVATTFQSSGVPSTITSVDYEQVTLTTAAPATDTDSDGMPDAYEIANGTNINVDDCGADKDSDGLSNIQEYLGHDSTDMSTGYGQTLSGTADSDGDGLDDGNEVHGTLNPWTGGVAGTPPGDPTNPNDPDSDNEGANDGDEIANGTDPNAAPPNTGPIFTFTDTDGDSYEDGAETAFGSSPSDAADCPDHSPNPVKPNVVIIYADDMGFGDMSAYGALYGTPSPTVTPSMNSLADEGVMFTQAHSSNGVCTPSRYALLTGKYNWRDFNGITSHYGGQKDGQEVPRPVDVTIAEFLKGHSYDTAAFGKWHLGGAFYTLGGARISDNPNTPGDIDWARPVEHHAVANGFDTFRGLATTINFGPYVYLHDDRVQYWDATLNGGAGGYRNATNSDTFHWFTTTELNSTVVGSKDSRASLGDPSYTQVGAGPQMISQVEDYISARAGSGDPDPFFVYVALYSPHKPWAITPPFVGAEGFNYGDFIKEVDDRIGRVVAAIDTNGFHDNTLIVFTSDNGPENTAMSETISNSRDANGPLRGNKRDVWDGGTRVPFVVRWPGQAAPGYVSNEVIWQGDIFATVAAYLGVELPAHIAPDGESFLNLIRGQRKPEPRRPSVIVSSGRGDLGLKTTEGWKFIDSSGGGNSTSWDSSNQSIPNAAGTNQGTPKQLFHQAFDLGEDNNLIAGLTTDGDIRSASVAAAGVDLLGELDLYRTTTTAGRFPRTADNDGDGMPNAFEIAHGLDPDSPKDLDTDLDGDGQSNGDEMVAGTDPGDPSDYFRIASLEDGADQFTVTWPSVVDRTYEVFWSTDLATWNLDSVHPGNGGAVPATLDKSAIDQADGTPGNLVVLFVRIGVSM